MKKIKSIVIGLTGPIASGKDVAAKVFRRYGAMVIDVDSIGHKVILPQSGPWHKIAKVFGTTIFNRGGFINRKKLAGIVFSRPEALKKINSITHPEILKSVKAMINDSGGKKKLVIVNAAVLKDIGLIPYVDRIVVVLASKEKRLKRLISLGFSRKEALLRMASQKSDREYTRIADHVVHNNGSKQELQRNIKEMMLKLG